jgi:hypothetical protein
MRMKWLLGGVGLAGVIGITGGCVAGQSTEVLGAIPPVNTAMSESVPKDLQEHWAKETTMKWVNKGAITGYPDGTFGPDRTMTRGEFATFFNKAHGYS